MIPGKTCSRRGKFKPLGSGFPPPSVGGGPDRVHPSSDRAHRGVGERRLPFPPLLQSQRPGAERYGGGANAETGPACPLGARRRRLSITPFSGMYLQLTQGGHHTC